MARQHSQAAEQTTYEQQTARNDFSDDPNQESFQRSRFAVT